MYEKIAKLSKEKGMSCSTLINFILYNYFEKVEKANQKHEENENGK